MRYIKALVLLLCLLAMPVIARAQPCMPIAQNMVHLPFSYTLAPTDFNIGDLDGAIKQFAWTDSVGSTSLGYQKPSILVNFCLTVTSNKTKYLLNVGSDLLSQVQLFIFQQNNLVYSSTFGDGVELSKNKKVPIAELWEPLVLENSGVYQVLLKINSATAIIINPLVASSEQVASFTNHNTAIFGALIGMLFAMCFCSFMLFLTVGIQRYAYYTIFILVSIMYILSYTRIGETYLWDKHSLINYWSIPITINLTAISTLLVCGSFLELKKKLPKYDLIRNLLMIFGLCIAATPMFFEYQLVMKLSLFYVVLASSFDLLCGAKLALKKERTAIIYFFGALIFLGACLYGSISRLFHMDGADTGVLVQFVGIVVDSAFLAFALAYKVFEQQEDLKQERVKLKNQEKIAEKADYESRVREQRARIEELGKIAVRLGDRLNSPLEIVMLALEELSDLAREDDTLSEIDVFINKIREQIGRIKLEMSVLDPFRSFVHNNVVLEDFLREEVEDYNVK